MKTSVTHCLKIDTDVSNLNFLQHADHFTSFSHSCGQEPRQQADVVEEGFDRVRRPSLIVQIGFPRVHRGDEGCLGSHSSCTLRGHVNLDSARR